MLRLKRVNTLIRRDESDCIFDTHRLRRHDGDFIGTQPCSPALSRLGGFD